MPRDKLSTGVGRLGQDDGGRAGQFQDDGDPIWDSEDVSAQVLGDSYDLVQAVREDGTGIA